MRNHFEKSGVVWFAELALSREQVLDPISTGEEFEISSHSVYWERKVLIDGIEEWLYKLELTGKI